MRFRANTASALAAMGMIVLILDSKTAIAGAQEGVTLCIRTVIPALFPFLILSGTLTASLPGSRVPLLRPIGKLFRIPPNCDTLLAVGFLGGYPVGAQNLALAVGRGEVSRETARRMVAFCNNAGPAFLFGIISPMFSSPSTAWFLWLIHIVSALLVSFVIPPEPSDEAVKCTGSPMTLSRTLQQSIRVMSMICGWVILFRTVLRFSDRWFLWAVPVAVRVLLSGMLELTNGCVLLSQIENEGLRFVICATLLGFGGICVTMQTVSIAGNYSLSSYFPGKALQTVLSFFLAAIGQNFLFNGCNFHISPEFFFFGCVLLFIVLFALQKKIIVAFLRKLVYNRPIDLKEG